MYSALAHKLDIADDGFTVIGDIYSVDEISTIARLVEQADRSNKTFRKAEDLFAIRQFLKEVPGVKDLIFNKSLKTLINNGLLPGTRTKLNQYAVQPPLDILQDNFTIRIHLDDTDEGNGALKVIAGSHLKGVWRTDDFDSRAEIARSCNVNAGSVMIMRPLLMHSSNRTTTNKRRRVIHIEFSKVQLPEGLNWAEREVFI